MSSRNDLRDVSRDEERRKRDEVRISTLQTQMDELRSLVRELSSRQARGEEQFKNYEAGIAHLRGQVEQHRHEVTQAAQARSLEDSRLRQQVADIDERIGESTRPVRALQAHVAEILEVIRRGRDEDQDDSRRFDEIRNQIEHVSAVAERNQDLILAVRDTAAAIRNDLEQAERDILKVEDSVRIVEQDARRRIVEANQEIENVGIRIDEIRPIFGQLDAQISDVRDSIRHVDPTLEELVRVDERLQGEITRFYSQSNERDDILGERVDELRLQHEISIRDMRQNTEQRFDHLTERVESFADIDRELAYRLNMIEMRLDELIDADVRLRRELWHLQELRVRQRFDQIQQELETAVEGRRAIEAEVSREAPRRMANRDRGEGIE
jgi:chromosome segregation ATPase